jgi:hypothetical protein
MPRGRTWIVAVVCGVVLALACVLWALLVHSIGTDVCTLPRIPRRAGPVTCHRQTTSVSQADMRARPSVAWKAAPVAGPAAWAMSAENVADTVEGQP